MELSNIPNTDIPSPKFRSCGNTGFQMTFSNGWTISVQFGQFNYCSNKNCEDTKRTVECVNAEVAVFGPDGILVRPDGFGFTDDVKGHVSTDEVSSLIGWISAQ
jgi:hypothetical protein